MRLPAIYFIDGIKSLLHRVSFIDMCVVMHPYISAEGKGKLEREGTVIKYKGRDSWLLTKIYMSLLFFKTCVSDRAGSTLLSAGFLYRGERGPLSGCGV